MSGTGSCNSARFRGEYQLPFPKVSGDLKRMVPWLQIVFGTGIDNAHPVFLMKSVEHTCCECHCLVYTFSGSHDLF